MLLRNTPNGYGLVSRFNHWATAAAMLATLGLGFILEEFDEHGAGGETLFYLHSSLAVLVMGLVLLRILWLPLGGSAPAERAVAGWQSLLARGTRAALWFCMIAMPLSGWLMASAEGEPVGLFGLLQLPILDTGHALGEVAEEVHESLPGVFIAALLLHVAGALFHHFVEGDDTLKRMTSGPG